MPRSSDRSRCDHIAWPRRKIIGVDQISQLGEDLLVMQNLARAVKLDPYIEVCSNSLERIQPL